MHHVPLQPGGQERGQFLRVPLTVKSGWNPVRAFERLWRSVFQKRIRVFGEAEAGCYWYGGGRGIGVSPCCTSRTVKTRVPATEAARCRWRAAGIRHSTGKALQPWDKSQIVRVIP